MTFYKIHIIQCLIPTLHLKPVMSKNALLFVPFTVIVLLTSTILVAIPGA